MRCFCGDTTIPFGRRTVRGEGDNDAEIHSATDCRAFVDGSCIFCGYGACVVDGCCEECASAPTGEENDR